MPDTKSIDSYWFCLVTAARLTELDKLGEILFRLNVRFGKEFKAEVRECRFNKDLLDFWIFVENSIEERDIISTGIAYRVLYD